MIDIVNPLYKRCCSFLIKVHNYTLNSYIFKHLNIREIVNHSQILMAFHVLQTTLAIFCMAISIRNDERA